MTVLVLSTLLLLLSLACLREARAGRAAWGTHLSDDLTGTTSWAHAATDDHAAGAPFSGVQASPGA